MKRTLSDAPVTGNVRTKQTVAAVLIGLPLAWNIPSFFLYSMIDDRIINLFGYLVDFTSCVGLMLLIPLAVDRTAKWTALFCLSWYFLCFAKNFVAFFGSSEVSIWMQIIVSYAKPVAAVVWLYLFSCVLQEIGSDAKERTWIGLLCLGWIQPIMYMSGVLNLARSYEENILTSNIYDLFVFVWSVLGIIAWFRFVRCGLYSGNKAEIPATEPVYTPLNRTVLGVLAAAAVTVAGLWVFYSYIVPEIGDLLNFKYLRLI